MFFIRLMWVIDVILTGQFSNQMIKKIKEIKKRKKVKQLNQVKQRP